MKSTRLSLAVESSSSAPSRFRISFGRRVSCAHLTTGSRMRRTRTPIGRMPFTSSAMFVAHGRVVREAAREVQPRGTFDCHPRVHRQRLWHRRASDFDELVAAPHRLRYEDLRGGLQMSSGAHAADAAFRPALSQLQQELHAASGVAAAQHFERHTPLWIGRRTTA